MERVFTKVRRFRVVVSHADLVFWGWGFMARNPKPFSDSSV